jgi:hypothetical protein
LTNLLATSLVGMWAKNANHWYEIVAVYAREHDLMLVVLDDSDRLLRWSHPGVIIRRSKP